MDIKRYREPSLRLTSEAESLEYFDTICQKIHNADQLNQTREDTFLDLAWELHNVRFGTVVKDGQEIPLVKDWGYDTVTEFFEDKAGDASYYLKISKIRTNLDGKLTREEMQQLGITKTLILSEAAERNTILGEASSIRALAEKAIATHQPVSKLRAAVKGQIEHQIGETIQTKTFTGKSSTFEVHRKLKPVVRAMFGLDYEPGDCEIMRLVEEWFLTQEVLPNEMLTALVYEAQDGELTAKRLELQAGLVRTVFQKLSPDEMEAVLVNLHDVYKKRKAEDDENESNGVDSVDAPSPT